MTSLLSTIGELSLAIFIFASFSATHANANGSQKVIRYKIGVQESGEVTQLANWLQEHNFDIAGLNYETGEVEIITDQEGISFLSSHQIKGFKVDFPGINFAPDSRYLNPQSLSEKLHRLARNYPSLTKIKQIGRTIQNRPIYSLLVSTTPDEDSPAYLDKPTILFDGEHHAREVMTPEVVVNVAETLLEGHSTDANIKNLLESWNFWLVPMVNPDGSNIVFTENAMWRKNAHATKKSVYGVDINRNYDYKWSACRGSSSARWSQDYHGQSPASEPETQALIELANSIRPSAYLSYHSYSELILFPYGCNNSLTPENTMIEKIAKELAILLPRDSGRGNYKTGASWQILYGVDGDSMSYMYANFGALSYTFEINTDFQPSYSIRDATLAKHRKAWKYFLDRANENILKVIVVDASTGKPTEALIDIDVIPHHQGELDFKTNAYGRFFKILDPGQYVVSAKLPNGHVARKTIIKNATNQTVQIEVQ